MEYQLSYRQIRKSRSELAQCTLHQCERLHVPLPSHFSKEMFTLGAFDNFDHQDRSSPSGINSNHDTVMTIFLVKPQILPRKPKFSIDLQTIQNLHFSLSCQNFYHIMGKESNYHYMIHSLFQKIFFRTAKRKVSKKCNNSLINKIVKKYVLPLCVCLSANLYVNMSMFCNVLW